MYKTDFTAKDKEVLDLTRDLIKNDFSTSITDKGLNRHDLENYLRDRINKDYLGGMTMYQALRRRKIEMYEIVEEIVNISIVDEAFNIPFIDRFVEIKNRALGDKTAWYSEGGTISVASFAGNHWDTNRQSIDLGEEFTLPKEWVYIHVYDELERFLLGITPFEKLLEKVRKALNKYFQDRIYLQFQNVGTSVPIDFVRNVNSEDGVGALCDVVQAAGGYSSLTIAGTRGAIRKLVGYTNTGYFADSWKESIAKTGSIPNWEGHDILVIPQTLKAGTFNLALNDAQLYIFGGDTKPIKLEWIGDTRTKMDTTGQEFNDMSLDYQVQTQFAIGMLLPNFFGMCNLA